MEYDYKLICAKLSLCCIAVDEYVMNPNPVSFNAVSN